MTTYEVLLLLDPEQAEAHQEELVARLRALVEGSGGTWRSHDAWGRRRLTYEIAKKSEGVYHLVVFESDPATLDEIVRVLKIDDAVLRQLATRHIEGSSTRAPREDTPPPSAAPAPAPAPEPAAVVPSVEYAEAPEANVRSDEEE
jgi:small subunit ribosomal protein S6